MNNIQKSFKNKAKIGLRMAVGGVIQPANDPFGFNNPKPRQELQRQSPLEAIDNRIAMNTAIDSSNMTMSEKAALGLGTTSADASALRQQTSALTSLRESMAQQPALIDDERQRQAQNFADGGVVTDPVEALLARTKASYGVGNASQPPAQAPVTPPVTPSAPQAKSGGLLDRAVQGLRGRAAQIDKAVGMAQGGVVKISGPGTGTSDDIPLGLRSNGKKIDVNVSNGEALAVLPAKTAENPEAIDAVNQIIETTNGKPPKGLRAGGHYADGTMGERKPYVAPRTNDPYAMVTGRVPLAANDPRAAVVQRPMTEETVPNMSTLPPVTKAKVEPTVAAAQPTPVAQAPAAVQTPEQVAAQRDASFAQASGVDPDIVKLAAGNQNRTSGFGTLRDATQFTVPTGSGGGVITGAPDKNGLRRAMVVLPNGAPTQQAQAGGAQPVRDSHGNDMTRTNEMKKQLTDMRLENAITDMQSAHPYYQQRGLRTMAAMMPQQELAQKQAETASLDSYRKGSLSVQNRQIDLQTALAEASAAAAKAKAGDEGVAHGEKVLSESGLEGDDQKLLLDLVHFNYPNFYSAGKAKQYEMLPRIKGELERLKKIRANTTNGVTSLRPGEVAGVDTLNYSDDVEYDPEGIISSSRWFGSDTDPGKMGLWNVFKRKNLPDAIAGSQDVYVLDDGTRVMKKGLRGEAGPLGNLDTKAIVNKQLKKHEPK